jgi:hypothetical protein
MRSCPKKAEPYAVWSPILQCGVLVEQAAPNGLSHACLHVGDAMLIETVDFSDSESLIASRIARSVIGIAGAAQGARGW